jgi:hypothetical protein
MKRVVLSAVVFFALLCRAQVAPINQACLSQGTYSAALRDAFSFSTNPAALGNTKEFSAGMYSEKPFAIKEFNTGELNVAVPVPGGGLGISVLYTGTTNYSASVYGLAYGISLGSKMNAGLLFNRYQQHLAGGYGNLSSLNYVGSFLLHFSEDFQGGISMSNARTSAGMKIKHFSLPTVYTIGFGYILSPLCFLTSEIEKKQSEPVNISGGIHYGFDEKLFVRAGFVSSRSAWYLGTGIQIKSLFLVVIVSIHPQLGITPGLQLLFHGKKNQK